MRGSSMKLGAELGMRDDGQGGEAQTQLRLPTRQNSRRSRRKRLLGGLRVPGR